MNWIVIERILSVLVGIITISGTGFAINGKLKNWLVGDINKKVNKLILYGKNLPITSRIYAGEAYVRAGGGGLARKYYENLLGNELEKMENKK